MKKLKMQIVAAIVKRDVKELRDLKYKIWLNKIKTRKGWLEFMEWVNSEEGKAIRAYLEKTY